MMDRRTLLAALSAVAATPAPAQDRPLWSSPVIDMHWHLRRTPQANIAHLDGCGVTAANLLTSGDAAEQVAAARMQYPGRFPGWFAATDITKPEAEAFLTRQVKAGAMGLGELKFHVAAGGPELRRMYALAADLQVPILVHFQDVGHTPTEGIFATGWKQFAAILKAYPRTKFIGHADAFWANVSADYAEQSAYPEGPVARTGITDRLLSDYPNLLGDMSANSGNLALSRDPDFTVGFLERHQDKLHFGSDCNCTDGNGGGAAQNSENVAPRMRDKCVARETLKVLAASSSQAVFHKLTWTNAHRVLKLAA